MHQQLHQSQKLQQTNNINGVIPIMSLRQLEDIAGLQACSYAPSTYLHSGMTSICPGNSDTKCRQLCCHMLSLATLLSSDQKDDFWSTIPCANCTGPPDAGCTADDTCLQLPLLPHSACPLHIIQLLKWWQSCVRLDRGNNGIKPVLAGTGKPKQTVQTYQYIASQQWVPQQQHW